MNRGTAAPSFQRQPRRYVSPPRHEIEVHAPPPAPSAPSSSLASYLLPVLGFVVSGVGMVILTASGGQNRAYVIVPLAMMIVSLAGAVYNYQHERRRHADESARRVRDYQAYLAQRQQELESAADAQQTASSVAHPSIADCHAFAERRDPARLWERSPTDEDFLALRVGVAPAAPTFRVKPPAEPQGTLVADPLLEDARRLVQRFVSVDQCGVVVTLPAVGAVILRGTSDRIAETARALVLRLVTQHSPADVKLVIACSEAQEAEWRWTRWLPHVWDDEKRHRYLAAGDRAAAAMLGDVYEILKQREPQSSAHERRAIPVPAFVILISDPALLQTLERGVVGPLMHLLRTDGAAVGAFQILLDARGARAGAVIDLSGGASRLEVVGPPRVEQTFRPDRVPLEDVEPFARLLAPLRAAQGAAGTELPADLPLLRMFGVSRVEELDILGRWARSEPSRSLAAPFGVRAGGERIQLDFHEGGQGPHGLMAGATGSGKSQWLQTLVASLAVHYRPSELAFVLIDYKGGAMAKPFVHLPHQIGIIDNLGGNLSTRALTALRAESQRRQRIFDDLGLENIHDYIRRRRSGEAIPALPHIMILVDEFAELAKEEPDFLKSLVSIARLGRSLGMHLLLATQRPAGIVNEQITSNTFWYVCLRVTQREDSVEMLGHPGAASIRLPGRGYFRVKLARVDDMFQAGYGGAPYEPNAAGHAVSRIREVQLDGTRVDVEPVEAQTAAVAGPSQLEAVVDQIVSAAALEALPALPMIWLPPLPRVIPLAPERPEAGWDGRTWRPTAEWLNPVFGRVDDPANQAQRALRLPLGRGGHAVIVGAPGAGKSTALQTILTSLALDHSPGDLHLYLLDFAGRQLNLLESLPHVAAVILPDEPERVARLFRTLLREAERRKGILAAAGVGSLAAYRSAPAVDSLPAIVVVISNFIDFANGYADQVEDLARLSREGAAVGIHLLLTATTFPAVPMRISTNIALAVAFELNDPDYASVVGRTGGLTPAGGTPGRGLLRGAPPLEFQTAVLAEGSDADRAAAVRRMGTAMDAAWSGSRPAAVDELPLVVPLSDLLRTSAPDQATRSVPLALDGEDLRPFHVSLGDSGTFIIWGPPGCGKTTLLQSWLMALGQQLTPDDVRFYLLSIGRSQLLPFRTIPHTAQYAEDADGVTDAVSFLQTAVQERRTALEDARRASGGLLDDAQWLAGQPALVVAIDDLDQFRAAAPDATVKVLETLLKRSRGLGMHMIVAAPSSELSVFDPFVKALKEGQTGFMLGSTDHDDTGVMNVRVPLGQGGKALPPGRGYFVRRGRIRLVQTANCHHGEPTLREWVGGMRHPAAPASAHLDSNVPGR